MKRYLFLAVAALTLLASCEDEPTYAEQRDRELSAISNYISKKGINVIDESTFNAQGNTTDLTKNQYVLFATSGVYMQIVRKGPGTPLRSGSAADVLARFTEYNINGDSLQLSNIGFSSANLPDKFSVKNTLGTFTAQFEYGVMPNVHSSMQVPEGWLVPLTYINLGRPTADCENAEVRLIVPHDRGHQEATAQVYACHYDITYQLAN